MGGRRTSAVHSLAIGLVVCGIFWLVALSGLTRGVTTVHAAMEPPYGREMVYMDKPMALYEYGQRSNWAPVPASAKGLRHPGE